MLVLECQGVLDLVEFGANPGIIDVAVRVQLCEGAEAFLHAAVVDEPPEEREALASRFRW